MDYEFDQADLTTYPQEVQEAYERDRQLEQDPGARGQMFRMLGIDPASILRRHAQEVVQERIAMRPPVRREVLPEDEAANQRRWKDTETYRDPETRRLWAVQPPLRLQERGDIDKAWIADVALDEDMALQCRIDLIVCYLNNFWAWVEEQGASMVGSKERSWEGMDSGRYRFVQRKAGEFEKSRVNWVVRFKVGMVTSRGEQAALQQVFGSALTRKSDVPKPPGKNEEFLEEHTLVPMEVFRLWKHSRLRRTIRHTVYDPTPRGEPGYVPEEEVINLWQGFELTEAEVAGVSETEEGGRRLRYIYSHMQNFMCNRDPLLMRQLIYHMAFMLQRPWLPLFSTHIFKGPQGVGKSIIIDAFMKIIGEWQCYKTTNITDITGTHTQSLENKYFVYLNEAFNAGDVQSDSSMKGLVTERSYRLRRFFQPATERKKFFRLMFDTNRDDVVRAERFSRRWCLVETSGTVASSQHFDRLRHCIYADDQMGLKAFADYLYRVDLDALDDTWKAGREPVQSMLLINQQLDSMEPLTRFVFSMLYRGCTVSSIDTLQDRDDHQVEKLRRIAGMEPIKRQRDVLQKWLSDHKRDYANVRDPDHPDYADAEAFRKHYSLLEACYDQIKHWIASGENWINVLPVKTLMRIYETEHQKSRSKTDQRMASGPTIIKHIKEMLGKEVQTYLLKGVTLIATEADRKKQADTRTQQEHEFGTTVKLATGRTERYIRLPLLHIAREKFRDYMGWRGYDPFEDRDGEEIVHRYEQLYDQYFKDPLSWRQDFMPTEYGHALKTLEVFTQEYNKFIDAAIEEEDQQDEVRKRLRDEFDREQEEDPGYQEWVANIKPVEKRMRPERIDASQREFVDSQEEPENSPSATPMQEEADDSEFQLMPGMQESPPRKDKGKEKLMDEDEAEEEDEQTQMPQTQYLLDDSELAF
jgi:hypothetical protein